MACEPPPLCCTSTRRRCASPTWVRLRPGLDTLVGVGSVSSRRPSSLTAAVHFSANDAVDSRAIAGASQAWPGRVGMLLSQRALMYTGTGLWSAICSAVKRQSPHLVVTLDHVKSQSQLDDILADRRLLDSVDVVMIDGSDQSFEQNVAWMTAARRQLPGHVEVEGALGVVANSASTCASTKVGEVGRYVEQSGCDLLGVSVNNVHLASRPSVPLAPLDLQLLLELDEASPVPLTLHGADFRHEPELRRASGCGAAKINIGPEYRTHYTGLLARSDFSGDDFRHPMRAVAEGLEDWVSLKVESIAGPG